RVACHFVAARWPDLAAVEPVVTARITRPLNPELLQRLAIDQSALAWPQSGHVEYSFTFAGETEFGDGVVAPLVASVTVDDQQRILKTTSSK
ncbi:MAG: hypothetical protein HC822_25085, partial [Oscillochloris sp.]|nr:hypothetical protein [Oscillochloris sp.]